MLSAMLLSVPQGTQAGMQSAMLHLRTRPGSLQSSRAMMGGSPWAETSSEAAASERASLPRARIAPFFVARACTHAQAGQLC